MYSSYPSYEQVTVIHIAGRHFSGDCDQHVVPAVISNVFLKKPPDALACYGIPNGMWVQ
jgi:hypothetical protein